MEKLGKFASWEILSKTLAIKYCDMSFFLHNGSGIPIQTRWFWGAEELKYPEKKDIIIEYEGKRYKAYIVYDIHDRTRLFWYNDLSTELNLIPYDKDSFPSLFVSREENCYVFTFHQVKTIEKENEDLESVVIESHKEGKIKRYYTTKYERNPINRKMAICAHGTKCMACGFDFEKVYGELGKDFIEVHHVVPLSDVNEEVEINPTTDLICLCSNCHRMIHRRKDAIITLEELKNIIEEQSK